MFYFLFFAAQFIKSILKADALRPNNDFH